MLAVRFLVLSTAEVGREGRWTVGLCEKLEGGGSCSVLQPWEYSTSKCTGHGKYDGVRGQVYTAASVTVHL